MGDQFDAFDTKLSRGLSVGDRSRDSSFLHGLPLLRKADLQPFAVPDTLDGYSANGAERPRSRDQYRAPLLIVREFLRSNGRPIAAVSPRDLVFTYAFFGAPLLNAGADTAHILAGILSSSLASWFFLMTGSTFGVSMRRLVLRDIEQMPVPAFEEARRSAAGRRLIELVATRRGVQFASDDWRAIDEAVFDLYDLDGEDRIVARDGLVRAGWQWRSGRLESAKSADVDPHILAYADTFLTAVDSWLFAGRRRRIRGEVFGFPAAAPHRVVRFVLEDGSGPSTRSVVQPQGNLRDVLDRIGERLNFRIGASLVGQRALRVYGAKEVVIVKPAARRHWMGVSALEDADAVVADSVAGFPS